MKHVFCDLGLSPEQRVAEAAAAIADISTADKLKRLLDLSQELLKQCDDHSGIHGMNKLRKKCEAELRFLRGVSTTFIYHIPDHADTRRLCGIRNAKSLSIYNYFVFLKDLS